MYKVLGSIPIKRETERHRHCAGREGAGLSGNYKLPTHLGTEVPSSLNPKVSSFDEDRKVQHLGKRHKQRHGDSDGLNTPGSPQ